MPKRSISKVDLSVKPISAIKGVRFERGPGNKKYRAILPNGKKVTFGAKGYQHYKDRIPKSQGGGLYKNLDHSDKERRKRYRTRHSGVATKSGKKAYQIKYSPSWFSYWFLW